MVTRIVFCAFLLAMLGGGCGEDPARERGETAPAPRPAPQTITEIYAGESFLLSAGSETRLRLSGDYVWSEPTVRGDAVELAPVDYFQDPGFSEWTIFGARPGSATIAARGTPACAGQERCPDEPLRFETRITVVP
jgi:hypothetical protein